MIGIALFPLAGLLTFAQSRLERAEIAAARRRRLVRAAYRLFVAAARITGLFRVAISSEDRERLADIRGSVVVANHISLIDVVIIIAFLGDTTAVAKVAASRNPFYAHIVRSVFLVNDDAERVLDDASRLLAKGVNLIVFPEGTRTHPNAANRKLRRGAAQIAFAAGAPLEVMRITSDPLVLAKGQPWYDVGAHTIVYALEYCGTIHADSASPTLPTPPTPPKAPTLPKAPKAPKLPKAPDSSRHSAAIKLTSRIAAVLFK